jgi:hypothetical protein
MQPRPSSPTASDSYARSWSTSASARPRPAQHAPCDPLPCAQPSGSAQRATRNTTRNAPHATQSRRAAMHARARCTHVPPAQPRKAPPAQRPSTLRCDHAARARDYGARGPETARPARSPSRTCAFSVMTVTFPGYFRSHDTRFTHRSHGKSGPALCPPQELARAVGARPAIVAAKV